MHDALRGIKGVVDLRTELQVDVPYISVEPDLEKAARYGLKPGDIRREAAVIVAGEEVWDLHVDGKVYDVIAWSTPSARRDVQSIRDLPLDTPGAATCAWPTSPTCTSARPPTRSRARTTPAGSTSA